MCTNNQSKSKQIKNIPLRYNRGLKKSPSKDNKPLSQLKGNQHNIVSIEKSKTHKKKQKFQAQSKSKKKNFEAKAVHQEYYIQQKRQQYLIKGCNEQQLQKNQQKSKFLQINQFQLKNLGKDLNDYRIRNKLEKINQFCLPQYRKVLNIQSKFIIMPPKGYTESLYHNYNNFQSFQEVGQQKYINFRDKKFKIRPRQKSQKHLRSKSRQNIKSKVREKNCKSQQNITIQKQNLFIQQTQISPLKQKEYLRQQKFDFQQIAELIQQDLKFYNQIKISNTLDNIRKQCIKLMSQISGEIGLRRQTFYLAMSIFDRTISKKTTIQNYKLLALVSLTLAMKLEQARRAEQFIYVLGVVNTGKESYIQSISSCKSSSKPKQNHKKSHQSNDRSIINKKQNSFKINIKEQNLKKISISAITKILKKHTCSKIQKFDFMDIFRLWRIQAIFWVDLLTCLWDQHIIANKQNVLQSSNLFFRSSFSLKNIHYLYQILEMAYIDKKVYSYPSIHIVLSAIYLLVRITKQNDDKGYQQCRQSLANSTNILFVDKTGINQIYWLFLDKIKIQMVEILACCQFISNFLQPSVLKNPSIIQDLGDSIDNKLSLHQFNSDLYLHNN